MAGREVSNLTIIETIAAPLIKYEAAVRALAEAKSVDEVKDFRNKSEAMRAYARQAKNRQMEIDAAEIRIRAERRIGELMADQRSAGFMKPGNPEGWAVTNGLQPDPLVTPITLAEAGIDKHLADRARKMADVPETEFEGIVADWRGRIEHENERVSVNLLAAADKHVRGTFGTGENEWYTPDDCIALATKVLGDIDLDPASCEIANRVVNASSFYSLEDDGLAQEWFGNVWLNPPYAQPAIAHFADKMVAEVESGRVNAAIMLTHNYTDTAWFQKLARAAAAICFTRGRVRFVSPEGDLAAPTQGQAFFYFGKNPEAFADVFKDKGFIAELAQ